MQKNEIVARLNAAAEAAAQASAVEIVEVELKGSGRHQHVRVYIDRPEGVTHADCEAVSRAISAAIDADDPFPGQWELEVSSPGVERKLTKWSDWPRFIGKAVKVVLKEQPEVPGKPVPTCFDGHIASAGNDAVSVRLKDGREISFDQDALSRANLRFEW